MSYSFLTTNLVWVLLFVLLYLYLEFEIFLQTWNAVSLTELRFFVVSLCFSLVIGAL